MKRTRHLPIFAVTLLMLGLMSCEKEDVLTGTPYQEYDHHEYFYPLEVGNFWVYRAEVQDSLGNITQVMGFDTVKVIDEKVEYGKRYFQLSRYKVDYDSVWVHIATNGLVILEDHGSIMYTFTEDTLYGQFGSYTEYFVNQLRGKYVSSPVSNFNDTRTQSWYIYFNPTGPAEHQNSDTFAKGFGLVEWTPKAPGEDGLRFTLFDQHVQ